MARRPRYSMAQRLRDPAKRSRLPLSALSPVQQRQRRVNQRIAKENANPLLSPTTPLSGHNLAASARQVAALQFNPQIAALQRQQATTTTQANALEDRSRDYYTQMAGQEAERHARLQAINQMASKQIAGVGEQSRAQFDRQDDAEAQRVRADISQRGQGLQDSAGQLAELAAARGRSATLQQGSESAAAAQGANWEALNTTLGQATQMRGQEIQGELANRKTNALAELARQVVDVQGQKGAAESKAVLDLRNTEFENQATMAGLGLKQADLEQQATDARANRAVKREGIRTTAAQRALDRAQAKALAGERTSQSERNSLRSAGIDPDTGKPIPGGRLDPKAKPGKKPRAGLGSLTQTQENTAHGQIRKAQGVIQQYFGKLTPDQLRDGLNQGYLLDKNGKRLTLPRVDPLYIEAALELEHGGLRVQTARALQRAGIHLGGHYRVRKPSTNAGIINLPIG